MRLRRGAKRTRPFSGSLALAFLGILGYVAGEVAHLDTTQVGDLLHLSPTLLQADAPLLVAGSSAVAFAGLLGTLWWANRATGRSALAWSGLALGSLGVLTLLVAGAALPILLIQSPTLVPSYLAGAGTLGTILGTILSFLGLAFLCAGLGSRTSSGRPAVDPETGAYVPEDTAGALDSLSDLLEGL